MLLVESVSHMIDIYSMTREKLEEYFVSKGLKKYKATQIFEWLYDKKVTSFKEMTNLKKELIESLEKEFYFGHLDVEKKQTDKDVNKYLFKLSDENLIECVLMKHDYGLSLCISSQIGCNMGCAFCASGKLKKVRNLTAGEMVEEVLTVQNLISKKINSVVVMGIGEPFDNYKNLLDALRIINDDKGLKIGARHITVSTSGIVPMIKEFASFPLQINLAISLHASSDEVRNKLMPINKAYNIEKLVDAIKYYISKTNRRVTIEYILLEKINDTEKDAYNLVKLLKGINVYVNLIPYNDTDSTFTASSEKRKDKFFMILKQNGITVTVRRKFGSKIDAACGQLRALEVKK